MPPDGTCNDKSLTATWPANRLVTDSTLTLGVDMPASPPCRQGLPGPNFRNLTCAQPRIPLPFGIRRPVSHPGHSHRQVPATAQHPKNRNTRDRSRTDLSRISAVHLAGRARLYRGCAMRRMVHPDRGYAMTKIVTAALIAAAFALPISYATAAPQHAGGHTPPSHASMPMNQDAHGDAVSDAAHTAKANDSNVGKTVGPVANDKNK